jgi:hypothetical protein
MNTHTLQAVERVVFDAYVEGRQALTVNEIRERTLLSATSVRNAVTTSRKLARTRREVAILSKRFNAKNIVHQHREVAAYYPTRDWLVEVIDQLRREKHYNLTERKFR